MIWTLLKSNIQTFSCSSPSVTFTVAQVKVSSSWNCTTLVLNFALNILENVRWEDNIEVWVFRIHFTTFVYPSLTIPWTFSEPHAFFSSFSFPIKDEEIVHRVYCIWTRIEELSREHVDIFFISQISAFVPSDIAHHSFPSSVNCEPCKASLKKSKMEKKEKCWKCRINDVEWVNE